MNSEKQKVIISKSITDRIGDVSGIKTRTLIVRGERVELTKETILKTCQSFANSALACIEEAANGIAPVNDLAAYTLEQLDLYQKYITGSFKPHLGFWQKAYYIQTGESVPILGR